MAAVPATPECGAEGISAPASNGQNPLCILLVDDDREDFLLTREMIEELGGRFTLDWAETYEAGVEAICSGTHDVYLLDYRLGARTGIELLKEADERGCSGPVILLTGRGQHRTDLEALDAGADDYLEKSGLTAALLERSIRYALVKKRQEADLEQKVLLRTEELARANQALREADRRKDEFLSTLGHELRNPLAPILNALEIVRLSGDSPETISKQRMRIERQILQMARLVDDLLDVSRISTGKLLLNLEPISLQDVFDSSLDTCSSRIEKARLDFSMNLPSEPILLNADRARLGQVFSNLLINAAKYTEPGGRVTVTAQVANGRVEVRIRDTGVGIAHDVLPQVFELFTQVDRSLNRSQGGLGIGLALVRRLVEMHGGTVQAASDGPGTGAEFAVQLPIACES